MGIEDWHKVVQDREKWRDKVVMAKTLRRVIWPEEEDKREYRVIWPEEEDKREYSVFCVILVK